MFKNMATELGDNVQVKANLAFMAKVIAIVGTCVWGYSVVWNKLMVLDSSLSGSWPFLQLLDLLDLFAARPPPEHQPRRYWGNPPAPFGQMPGLTVYPEAAYLAGPAA